MCRERKWLAGCRLATEAVWQVVVAGAASVECAVDGGVTLLDALLFGDHLGTPVCLMRPVSRLGADEASPKKRNPAPRLAERHSNKCRTRSFAECAIPPMPCQVVGADGDCRTTLTAPTWASVECSSRRAWWAFERSYLPHAPCSS